MSEKLKKRIADGDLAPMAVGINGPGRMGKITLWNFIAHRYFKEVVVNVGRAAGNCLEDIINNYIKKDSTYGSLERYLYGHRGCGKEDFIRDINEEEGTFIVNDVRVRILRETRVPELINWRKYGVKLVAEMTGKFKDPARPSNLEKGSLRGHFVSGAEKVVLSAPFKGNNEDPEMAEKCITVIAGINDEHFNPNFHSVISAGSCTTTCAANLVKPLFEEFGEKILIAHMLSIHAATGSQEVLDRIPEAGAKDQRKNRSTINNIILTSTGAAKALSLVIEEVGEIEFGADSARVPTNTGSMIMLTLTFDGPTDKKTVNGILEKAAKEDRKKFLVFDNTQNVSSDIIGSTAACQVEAEKTQVRKSKDNRISTIVLFALYDNEWGYGRSFAELFLKIAEEYLPQQTLE